MTKRSVPHRIIKEKRANTPEGMEYCLACDKYKSRTEFSSDRTRSSGLARYCRACIALRLSTPEEKTKRADYKKIYDASPKKIAYKRAYNARPEVVAIESIRDEKRRYGRYGITQQDYDEMLNLQGGVCAICGEQPQLNRPQLSIDHDHVTGKVRGLLCRECNWGLGRFRDDPKLLANAISYLMGLNR